MDFEIEKATEILERTPSVLRTLLAGLSPDWTENNEGPDTWSTYDVIGHLIHGENTDWIPRAKLILGCGPKEFEPFDRFAQFENSQGKSLINLLDEFHQLRKKSLNALKALNLNEEDLTKIGFHPEFGEVNLKNLLASWVAHDMAHLAQISRVMAKQYKSEVGPWSEYISILNK